MIYDWKFNYVDIKWFKVAITRCEDLDNVYFYDGDENKYSLKYQVNINGYIQQDKKANREFDEKKYINDKWLSE